MVVIALNAGFKRRFAERLHPVSTPSRHPLRPSLSNAYREQLAGLAIVEERESAVVVNGPTRIGVDRFRNLTIYLEAAR